MTKSSIQIFLRLGAVVVVSLNVLAGAQDPQTTPAAVPETASANSSTPAKQNSADLLRTFKTIHVQSKTPLAKPQLLAGELQKKSQLR